MTDQRSDSDEAGGGAQRLFEALRGAASDAATRETLRQLGDRARGVVEELARNARSRAAATQARTAADEEAAARRAAAGRCSDRGADSSAFSALAPDLRRQLDELRSCIGEVADTMTATVERLETIEFQLGDPGTGIETLLAGGLERCERMLMGIEHRFSRAAGDVDTERDAGTGQGGRSGTAGQAPAMLRTILVVAESSADRAAWCVGLEKQGLRCVAATDLAGALRAAGRQRAAAALVVVADSAADDGIALDDWKDAEEQGTLPPVLLLAAEEAGGAVLRSRAEALGLALGWKEHGAAATAACLLRLGRTVGEPAGTDDPTGDMTT